jgi:hypothetical protein
METRIAKDQIENINQKFKIGRFDIFNEKFLTG